MATVMELMRELKHLGDLKKAGQLPAELEERLVSLKTQLDGQLSGQRPPVSGHTNPGARPPPASSRSSARPQPLDDGHILTPEARAKLGSAVAESEARADAAVAATKQRPPARNADEAVTQLREIARGNTYTPSASALGADEYFGYGDGYTAVPEAPVELALIDPRAEELKAMSAQFSNAGALPTVAQGGVFLDDFLELYTSGLLSPEAMWEEDGDLDDPNLLIPGKRKVTVHMLSGEVKRGVIQRMARADLGFNLLPVTGAGKPEAISLMQIKAIFVTLNPGQAAPIPAGKNVTVTFQDRRSIQGATPDQGQGPSFTLVPPPGRLGVEKIIVNQGACLEVR